MDSECAGIPSSITIGTIPIEGIGSIKLEFEFSITGTVALSLEGEVNAGFSYERGWGLPRLIKGFNKKDFSLNAEVEITEGLKLSANIDLASFVEASIWVAVGAKANCSVKAYDDDESPKICTTIREHLYANIGAGISINYVLDDITYEVTQDIFTEENSPIRIVYHYEDGELVSSCARGEDISYVTPSTSKYFNPFLKCFQNSYIGADGTPIVLWNYTLYSNNDEDINVPGYKGIAVIKKYNGTASSVVIPYEIDGYKVTQLNSRVFADHKNLKSVVIPDGVTNMNHYVFAGCSNLKSVTLSKLLTRIGGDTFQDCISLTSIDIPDSVANINNYAFQNCSNLKNVRLGKGLTTIEHNAFYNCTSLESIIIPSGVTNIENKVFRDCNSLKNVTIPNSITNIGKEAFVGCSSLKQITIPNSVTSIGDSAFSNCGLTSITIPDSITSISSSMFHWCSDLQSVDMPDTVTDIGEWAFFNCTKLSNITLPDNLESIGGNAFYQCNNLKSIIIPNNVVSIGEWAFKDCSNLTDIVIGNSVTSIGDLAFQYCTSLTDVYYNGTEEEWKNITIGQQNDSLINATIHFNSTGPAIPKINEINIIPSDDNLNKSIEAQFVNIENSEILITAFYNGNTLISSKTENLSAGDTSKTVAIPDNADSVKVYIWDSLDGMRPLCETKTKTIE